MIIDAVRMPENIERGAIGGPEFKTSIIETDGGNEIANINWVYPRISWQCSFGIQTKEDLQTMLKFFYARRGRARGFLFKDFSDYEVAAATLIGTGDSTDGTDGTDDWQIVRVYTDSVLPFSRKITRPVAATVIVKVDGVTKTLTADYTVSATTGIVHFTPGNVPLTGEAITVECEFDVPVRFINDKLSVAVEWEDAMAIPDFGIIEVRE